MGLGAIEAMKITSLARYDSGGVEWSRPYSLWMS